MSESNLKHGVNFFAVGLTSDSDEYFISSLNYGGYRISDARKTTVSKGEILIYDSRDDQTLMTFHDDPEVSEYVVEDDYIVNEVDEVFFKLSFVKSLV